jgi:hypothetical protein
MLSSLSGVPGQRILEKVPLSGFTRFAIGGEDAHACSGTSELFEKKTPFHKIARMPELIPHIERLCTRKICFLKILEQLCLGLASVCATAPSTTKSAYASPKNVRSGMEYSSPPS